MRSTLLTAIAIAASIPAAGCGSDDDGAGSADASGNGTDRAFVAEMIPHHEGAVTMGKAELEKGADPELKALAEDIIRAQEREIAQMQEHLGDPGADHGAGHSG